MEVFFTSYSITLGHKNTPILCKAILLYMSTSTSANCFINAVQELMEIFLHVTLGSCPDLLVLQITRVICADVMRL